MITAAIVTTSIFGSVLAWNRVQNKVLFDPEPSEYTNSSGICADFDKLSCRIYKPVECHDEKRVMVYCHSSRGVISDRFHLQEMSNAIGFDLFIFDYPGYGKSEGVSSQQSILQSGDKIVEKLKNDGYETFVFLGESIGGAPASYLACKYKDITASLILLSTFPKLSHLSYSNFINGKFSWVLEMILKVSIDDLSVEDWVSYCECFILVGHSCDDTLIPISGADQIFRKIKHDKKSYMIYSGEHNLPELSLGQTHSIIGTARHGMDFIPCNSPLISELLEASDRTKIQMLTRKK